MLLSAIVAMTEDRVIGKNNQLPWHLPADLRYFKNVTMGKPIIMGRKTYESIGKPLPGRTNIVLSRASLKIDNVLHANSLESAKILVPEASELMIIGGAQIFAQTIQQANRLYLTKIHQHFNADVFFPAIDWDEWKLTSKEDFYSDEKRAFDYTFEIYDRK